MGRDRLVGLLGSGVDNTVNALAVAGGSLYAGGTFTTAGGGAANSIAQWDGTAWSALGSGVNNTVGALAVADGRLYVGGGFSTAGGRFSPYAAYVNLSACGPGIALTTGTGAPWQQLALPCVPDANPAEVGTVLGAGTTGQLDGAIYGNAAANGWLMYGNDLVNNKNLKLAVTDTLTNGVGYWIKSFSAPVGGATSPSPARPPPPP